MGAHNLKKDGIHPVRSLNGNHFEYVNNGMKAYKTLLGNITRFGDLTG